MIYNKNKDKKSHLPTKKKSRKKSQKKYLNFEDQHLGGVLD